MGEGGLNEWQELPSHFRHSHSMRFFSRLFPCLALVTTLLLSGCVAPGYPYTSFSGTTPSGYAPYRAVPPPSGSGSMVQAPPSYPQGSAPGVVVAGPGYPYPYVYAPAPALIAPTLFVGSGNGYWYGNRFWPYRSGCAFYGGRYYGGYGNNYWRRGYGGNWNR
jgi:hypothetical protein